MINPVFVYIAVWGLVLFLYSLGLTSNLVDFSLVGVILIVLNLLSILLIFFFLGGGGKQKSRSEDDWFFQDTVRRFLKFVILVWMSGTFAEIIYSGGFPLYWKLIGDTRLYTEFGIPSFHGIMNAFYLQALSMACYLFLKFRRFKFLFLIVVLLFWPIFMLGRGILLGGLLQMACVLFLLTRLNAKKIFALTLGLIGVIIAFGYIGDLRQTANPFSYLVTGQTAEVFSVLPSGFLWFYVYLTAGLSNLFHNIDSLAPAGGLSYTFSNMLPSIVRSYFEIGARNDLFVFVDPNLNTSTIYAGAVSDLGPVGGFFAVLIVQLVCCYAYILSLKGKPWGIFAYTVAFQILTFSIFYDMFFLLPTLFQFAICFLLYVYCFFRRRSMRLISPSLEN
ncbi:O-antigen polymerase [Pseudomonas gessardii]|uniref:Oligosaccharide repeat unit polymerase n=1 Tax=Pseudomonas gessardii TaxID=78544 RepID=A0A7Y1MTH2_9PSED|nr:O-antigen polymerase [Pseudomonas gessardii]NNA97961.1 oligosaccharide repeat unit polymerase [Pseudomonas gessardii]